MRALILTAALLVSGCAATHQHLGDCPTCLGTAMFLGEKAKQEGAQAAVDYIGKALNQQAQRPQQRATTAPVTSE